MEHYYFFCSKTFKFIPRQQLCDEQTDCFWGEDEEHCVQRTPLGPSLGGERGPRAAQGAEGAAGRAPCCI